MGKCILAGHPQGGGQIGYGTYTGDDASSRTISLGVTPKWVLVLPNIGVWGAGGWSTYGGLFLPGKSLGGNSSNNIAEVCTGGFIVKHKGSSYTTNYSGSEYYYIYGT